MLIIHISSFVLFSFCEPYEYIIYLIKKINFKRKKSKDQAEGEKLDHYGRQNNGPQICPFLFPETCEKGTLQV